MSNEAISHIRDTFYVRQPVRVRIKQVNRPALWVEGTIVEKMGRVAKVRTAKTTSLYPYCDLEADLDREPIKREEPKSGTFATLGDVVTLPIRIAEPPPPPPAPPVEEETGNEDEDENENENEDDMAAKKHRRAMIYLPAREKDPERGTETAIGSLFRDARHKIQMAQGTLAEKLGLPDQSTLSRIELGRQIPDDEVLIKFQAEFPHLDLDTLQRMRDRDASKRPRVAKKLGLKSTGPVKRSKGTPIEQLGIKVNPVQTAEALVLAGSGSSGGSGDETFDYIESLSGVAPIPTDPEKRRVWMGLAKALRSLTRG